MERDVDAQIVGGGLAGLIAANLTADAGLSVRLIEKRSTGGRASSAEHHGFRLNQGPHALYVDGELNQAMATLGIEPRGVRPPVRGALGSIGHRLDVLPQGPRSLWQTSLLSARGKWRLLRFMARLPKMSAEGLGSVTVADWIDSITDAPDLRALLHGLVTVATYNSAADLASADAAVRNTQRAYGAGVLYLDGGWQQLVDALDERLEGRVERVHGAVTAVDATADGWACRVGDRRLRSRSVLLAPGAPGVIDRLVGPVDGPSLAEQAGPPVRVAALDLGLRSAPDVDFALDVDQARYYSRHSVAAGMAPDRRELVSLVRYLRPDDDVEPDASKAMLLAHARLAGVTEDDIITERYLHRLPVTWGMPLAERGGLAGRPTVDAVGQPGLYIAGDWVGQRGLLSDAAAASAVDAAAAIVARSARRPASTSVARAAGR